MDDQDEVADVVLALLSDDPVQPNVGLYGMFWVLDALGRSGRIDAAIEVIKNYYGYMLNQGATSWWERLDADQVWTQSLSHGWGVSPTWFLTTYVLGARVTGPNTWVVQPALSGVNQVSGAISLQRGILQTSWERFECGHSQVNITADAGLSGEVILSDEIELETIKLDDLVVWHKGEANIESVMVLPDSIHVRIGDGTHRIQIVEPCVPNGE
jgi:hypothetical protein